MWEVIVVNDSPVPLPKYTDDRVIVIDSPNRFVPKNQSVGNRSAMARNEGIRKARGEFVLFLDADDYLLSSALERLIRAQASHSSYYTYSSHYSGETHLRPPDYDQRKYAVFNIHPITCLIPTEGVRDVNGFDEAAPGWEDWTLFLRLAIAGYCGKYERGPIFVYRDNISINHYDDVAGGQALMDKVTEPYRTKEGVIHMASCCGANKRPNIQAVIDQMPAVPVSTEGTQILEYTGQMTGSFILKHPTSKREYKSGGNASVKFISVPSEDVPWLLSLGYFRPAMPPAPYEPPPPPADFISPDESVIESMKDEDASYTISTSEGVAPASTKVRGRPKNDRT